MIPSPRTIGLLALCLAALGAPLAAQQTAWETMPAPWDQYIRSRAAEIAREDWQSEITKENWPERRAEMRKELRSMLGLEPMPERTPLNPVVTGTLEQEGFVVEKLHFQSSPGLYVTANLYRPKTVTKPLPAILYVCGHAGVVEDGVSLGNKTAYQHHGAWFAQNGYVCLILDTIQLGEISGHHHGTYRMGRWWWVSRGYTPAGVEAWNGIRALDYLQSRPEVDGERIGMTGRSGGGAYSWWVAALDERVKVAVPTAGITSMHNHVVDGVIEGHCDCMFMVNSQRWDFDRVAALVAPRALMIANTDSDDIFPLDGVVETFNKTRSLYRKLGEEGEIALHIGEGPHKDTQPLHTAAFHWFNRFLKGGDRMDVLDVRTAKAIPAKALKVFEQLPSDERVTTVDEFFVPGADLKDLSSKEEWSKRAETVLTLIRTESFQAWPVDNGSAPELKAKSEYRKDVYRVQEYEVNTQEGWNLPLWVVASGEGGTAASGKTTLKVLDQEQFGTLRAVFEEKAEFDAGAFEREFPREGGRIVFFAPRGVGSSSWEKVPEKKQTHLLRRLQLLGETLESGQVWDIIQAAKSLRPMIGTDSQMTIQGRGTMAVNSLYASLFLEGIQRVELDEPSPSHRGGPTYLNVLRHTDVAQSILIAGQRAEVRITSAKPEQWKPMQDAAEILGVAAKIRVVAPNSDAATQ